MRWWLRRKQEEELDRELRDHLDLEAEEQRDAGVSPDEAQFAARRALGNTTLVKEDVRAMWGWTSPERLIQDVRYGVRTLLKSRTFTLVAVLALALGIGANTAVFSVVNAVLLRPLPYAHADRLIELWEMSRQGETSVSYPDFLDWRRQSDLFEEMAIAYPNNGTLTGAGPAERISLAYVSHNFFDVFSVQPVLGRGILPHEDQKGGSPVAVLSHEFWQRRFAGDSSVVGRAITLDKRSLTVIGVLPPRAFAEYRGRNGDVYVPVELGAAQFNYSLRGNHSANGVVARVRAGVTIDQVRSQLETIAKGLERQYPESNTGVGAGAAPLRARLGGGSRSLLMLLLGAAALVLLIACVNVANLLLARSSARNRELTLRAALGASRTRLARQLLTESILLALAGGLLGIALARFSFDALLRLVPDASSQGGVALDWRVLGFTLGLSVLTGTLFGLAPAFQATRRNLSEAMRETARTSASAENRRLRNGLVIAEIAITFVLLVGAGLLLRSFERLLRVDPGFNPERVLTMGLGLPNAEDVPPAQSLTLAHRILERVENLPGVSHAGMTGNIALTGGAGSTQVLAEGAPDPGHGSYPKIQVNSATSGFFAAMGIPLLEGRLVSERDGFLPAIPRSGLIKWYMSNPNLSVVVNQTAARTFWPNQDPIGRRLRWAPHMNGPWLTVVGVVGDIKGNILAAPVQPAMYFSLYLYGGDNLVLRTKGDPAAIVGAVRREVQAVDPNVPITGVRTMREIISGSVAGQRTNALLVGLLAALALVLAVIGVYGVMAYSVAQRTQEMGVRLALGATGRDVLVMVLRNGGRLVLVGLVVGAAAALAFTRFIAGVLYGVGATDGFTFVVAGTTLALIALLACYIPARRATRVDPIQALRYE
jgi:putative ABC transport system permease protein